MIARLGECTKIHCTVCFKWVNFTVCKLYFNKAAFFFFFKQDLIKLQCLMTYLNLFLAFVLVFVPGVGVQCSHGVRGGEGKMNEEGDVVSFHL